VARVAEMLIPTRAVITKGRSMIITSTARCCALVSVDPWPDSGVFAATGDVSDLAVLDVDDAIVRETWRFYAPRGEARAEDTISDKTEGRDGKTLGKRHPGLL
jgi:hypothetical protein